MEKLRFSGSTEVEAAVDDGKPYRLLVVGEAHHGELLVQSARELPAEEGDVTVLGPEVFASRDRSVISWRGENYVLQRQPAAHAAAVAQAFHESYERLAPEHGYETREASAKPWEDVPEQNRGLMIATVQALLDGGVIAIGSGALRTAADADAVKRRVREAIDQAFHEWRPDHAEGAAHGDLTAKVVAAVEQVLTVELGLAAPAEAVQA